MFDINGHFLFGPATWQGRAIWENWNLFMEGDVE